MQNKLELKHLSAYLPYGLKVQIGYFHYKGLVTEMVGLTEDHAELIITNPKTEYFDFIDFFPILRPLSDLTKEIEHNGEKFIPMEYILSMTSRSFAESTQQEELVTFFIKDVKIKMLAYKYVEKLFEWHFDIFGLISEGLAIDLNTVK